LRPLADEAGEVLARHDDGDDEDQDGGCAVELVAVKRRIERGPDAAGADDPDHGRLAEVDVDAVERQPDEPRLDLARYGIIDHLPDAHARGPDGLDLSWVDLVDIVSEQLGEKAHGGERKREEAGQRAEPEHRDEEDRDDDLLEGAGQRDDAAAEA